MAVAEREIYAVAPSRLSGQVRISGAKNSALRLLVASLLTPEPVQLANYPDTLLDAQVQVDMLRALGKRCDVAPGRIVVSEDRPPTHRIGGSSAPGWKCIRLCAVRGWLRARRRALSSSRVLLRHLRQRHA